jgi:hypothetical protein
MKNEVNAKELFPNINFVDLGYQRIIDAFGKVAIQVDDQDYSGDSRVLYNEDGKFGVLIFGWGSCSGCDALLACNTHEDIQEVIDGLQQSIIWFDDAASALYYFQNHDWQGDFSWHYKETKEFVEKCIAYLKPLTAIEYMEKQVQKHRLNYKRESERGVPEEMLRNMEKKIGYYEAAVDALRKDDEQA